MERYLPYYELYSRCFPDFPTPYQTFLRQLRPEAAKVFSHWEGETLAGFAFLHGSSLALLCVEKGWQCQGIGGRLLAQAEEAAQEQGADQLVLGWDLLQGVPEGPAVDFFKARGYEAQWSSINMELALDRFSLEELAVPPAPVGLSFRFATASDRRALLKAVKAAEPGWAAIFETCTEPALLAVLNGEIAGFQILDPTGGRFGRPGDRTGSIGCVGVVPWQREKGIGLAMVAQGVQWLKEQQCAWIELRYTWLESWYGKLGFATVCRQWMGEKSLTQQGLAGGKM